MVTRQNAEMAFAACGSAPMSYVKPAALDSNHACMT
jgi:hypothetical protein